MRDELHEPDSRPHLGAAIGSRRRTGSGPSATKATTAAALEPNAVDAALADEATTEPTQRGSRRDLIAATSGADASKRKLDEPHVALIAVSSAASDGALLRSLSEQLHLLQLQQDQIRRLLEQAENRSVTGMKR